MTLIFHSSSINSIKWFLYAVLTFSQLSLLVFIPLYGVQAQEAFTIHVVAPGENLSTIARRYNITVSALMAYNNISNANIIRPGQQIRIPMVSALPAIPQPTPRIPAILQTSPTPTENIIYIVKPNETFLDIANRYSTSVIELTRYNGLTIRATPEPGMSLRIPPLVRSGGASGYTASSEPVYTVRRGDTLSGIASQYGVTVASILRRNALGSSIVLVGQRLIIPIWEAASTSVLTPRPTPRPTRQLVSPLPTPRPPEQLVSPLPTPMTKSTKNYLYLPLIQSQ